MPETRRPAAIPDKDPGHAMGLLPPLNRLGIPEVPTRTKRHITPGMMKTGEDGDGKRHRKTDG